MIVSSIFHGFQYIFELTDFVNDDYKASTDTVYTSAIKMRLLYSAQTQPR